MSEVTETDKHSTTCKVCGITIAKTIHKDTRKCETCLGL